MTSRRGEPGLTVRQGVIIKASLKAPFSFSSRVGWVPAQTPRGCCLPKFLSKERHCSYAEKPQPEYLTLKVKDPGYFSLALSAQPGPFRLGRTTRCFLLWPCLPQSERDQIYKTYWVPDTTHTHTRAQSHLITSTIFRSKHSYPCFTDEVI